MESVVVNLKHIRGTVNGQTTSQKCIPDSPVQLPTTISLGFLTRV